MSLVLIAVLSTIYGRPVINVFFRRCCNDDIENDQTIFANLDNNFLRERLVSDGIFSDDDYVEVREVNLTDSDEDIDLIGDRTNSDDDIEVNSDRTNVMVDNLTDSDEEINLVGNRTNIKVDNVTDSDEDMNKIGNRTNVNVNNVTNSEKNVSLSEGRAAV